MMKNRTIQVCVGECENERQNLGRGLCNCVGVR